jgi:hypothetical protein
VSPRRTRLLGRSGPPFVSHPSHSLIYLLEGVITVRLELAHRAMVGIHWYLFFMLDLEQS